MTYNIDKCKVLRTGSNNNRTNYSMNSTEITKVNEENDLGVINCKEHKPLKHCTEVVKTPNNLIGFIGRSFEFKSGNWFSHYSVPSCIPHFEYCFQFWSPCYRKDIDKLERVQ